MNPHLYFWHVALLAGLVCVLWLEQVVFVLAAPIPQTVDAPAALVAAGDIADCESEGDTHTADLLDMIGGTVATLGDNAYERGTLAEFNNCYEPTWGRYKARTHPAVGNHEYESDGAAGYYTYFGDAASPLDSPCTADCKGYYSYNLGAWHIIVLNSEIAAGANSAQEQWLRADLAANPATCTLAYWHTPRFSSGSTLISNKTIALWQALYDYGADVVLNGHEHFYERFAPQSPDGQQDDDHGIRQFIVGTGGRRLRDFATIHPNSEARSSITWGLLKLTLHAASYEWEFLPIDGQTFTDTGSHDCVSPAGEPPTPPNTAIIAKTPTPSPTDTASSTDTPSPTKIQTSTVAPTSTPLPTGTQTPTRIPTPTGTATSTPENTQTLTQTPTPTSTATPTDSPVASTTPPAETPEAGGASHRLYLPFIAQM